MRKAARRCSETSVDCATLQEIFARTLIIRSDELEVARWKNYTFCSKNPQQEPQDEEEVHLHVFRPRGEERSGWTDPTGAMKK
jgi:hypothetical protein